MNEDIKTRALAAAVRLSAQHDYKLITRQQIADQIHVSPSLLSWHFRSMDNFRDELVAYAIKVRCLPLIGRAIIDKHRYAENLSELLKKHALGSLYDG